MKRWEVHHGETLGILPTLPKGRFPLTMADLPYNKASKREYERTDRRSSPVSMDFGDWDYWTWDEIRALWEQVIQHVTDLSAERAAVYFFVPDTLLGHLIDCLQVEG